MFEAICGHFQYTLSWFLILTSILKHSVARYVVSKSCQTLFTANCVDEQILWSGEEYHRKRRALLHGKSVFCFYPVVAHMTVTCVLPDREHACSILFLEQHEERLRCVCNVLSPVHIRKLLIGCRNEAHEPTSRGQKGTAVISYFVPFSRSGLNLRRLKRANLSRPNLTAISIISGK